MLEYAKAIPKIKFISCRTDLCSTNIKTTDPLLDSRLYDLLYYNFKSTRKVTILGKNHQIYSCCLLGVKWTISCRFILHNIVQTTSVRDPWYYSEYVPVPYMIYVVNSVTVTYMRQLNKALQCMFFLWFVMRPRWQ